MPIKSEQQRKAMEAAAHGHSTLGIPKKVGEEFIQADGVGLAANGGLRMKLDACDDAQGHAAGIVFVAPDGDILLLRRSGAEDNFAHHWGLPGGGVEDGETPEIGAAREAREEVGFDADPSGFKPLDRTKTPTGLAFHTFALPVKEKFIPKLNDEHSGYAWSPMNALPGPLHPAVAKTLQDRVGINADMSPEDWNGLRNGFLKWTNEEEAEPDHAEDGDFDESKHPRAPDGKFGPGSANGTENVDNAGRIIVSSGLTDHDRSLPSNAPLSADKSVKGAASAVSRIFKEAFPDSDMRLVHSTTPAGDSSYLTFRLKEPEDDFAARKKAWDAAKGTKRGPPPTRRVADLEYRISDHDTGVRRSVHYQGHLRPDSTRKDVEELVARARNVFKEGASDIDIAATDSALVLALDRDSVRDKDRDGRLKVKIANISKANICPYRGKEIPGWDKLGLEPERIYNLLRAPDELKKAAESSNGVPLLRKHIKVSADDHQPYEVVGSLGSDGDFDGEYLTNSLFVNARDAIDGIESKKKRELSMGYHYTPDMTPGKFGDKAFDGVMRNIVVNHVALVEDGRCGPDVVVGDSMENLNMKTTRLAVTSLGIIAAGVGPLLAMDAKLPVDLFNGLTTKNFAKSKPSILDGIRKSLDGKLRSGLAMDASIESLAKLLDVVGEGAGADEEAPEDAIKKMDEVAQVEPAAPAKTTYDAEPLKKFLAEKGMGEDDIDSVMGMLPNAQAQDEDDDEDKKKAAAAEEERRKKEGAEDTVSKTAMDEALKTQRNEIIATERGIRVALAEVKPYVGELPVTLAFDSAEGVYRHTLKALGHPKHATAHVDALPDILKTFERRDARKPAAKSAAGLAMDESTLSKAAKFAPGLDRIKTLA